MQNCNGPFNCAQSGTMQHGELQYPLHKKFVERGYSETDVAVQIMFK